jgi:hypothetical protein
MLLAVTGARRTPNLRRAVEALNSSRLPTDHSAPRPFPVSHSRHRRQREIRHHLRYATSALDPTSPQ